MAGAASLMSFSAAPGAVAGARTLVGRSLPRPAGGNAGPGGDCGGAANADPPDGQGHSRGSEPVGRSDRAVGFRGATRRTALRALPARRSRLEAGAEEILRPQGFPSGAGVMEGAGGGGCPDSQPSTGGSGAGADRGCGVAWAVRAVARVAHHPCDQRGGSAAELGDAAGEPSRSADPGRFYLSGHRALAAGVDVPAVCVCGVERRD